MPIQYMAPGFEPSEHESPPITTSPGQWPKFNANVTLQERTLAF